MIGVMLTSYIRAAMRRAKYEILPDDNSFYGHIPGFDGLYGKNWKTRWRIGSCWGSRNTTLFLSSMEST